MMDAGVRVRTIVARGGVVIADIPYTLALTLSEYFSRLVDIFVLRELVKAEENIHRKRGYDKTFLTK